MIFYILLPLHSRTILSIIGFLILCGTLIEVYQHLVPKYKGMGSKALADQDSFGIKLLKSFSVYTNGRKILNSKAGAGNGHLGCLSGIRCVIVIVLL